MTRIEGEDTVMGMVIKMSDGNPGAINAISLLMSQPDGVLPLHGFPCLLLLDTLGIYGTDIYILFSDNCNKDVVKFSGLLFAFQHGKVSGEELKRAAGDQMRQNLLDVDSIIASMNIPAHPDGGA